MIDLTNRVFERLTVVRFSHKDKRGQTYWCCTCSCGKDSVVRGSHLTGGLIKSCGCLKREPSRGARENLIGMQFDRLTVKEYSHSVKGTSYWICLCSCGNTTTVSRQHLIKGDTKSCGCRRQEECSKLGKILHLGKSHHRWNGGTTQHAGYNMVMVKGHPRADLHGYVREHIIIAEQALGKHLPKKAVVHHHNGAKDDNRPGNLVICQDQGYHLLLHQRAKRYYQKVMEAYNE